jgi:hypothetical protein
VPEVGLRGQEDIHQGPSRRQKSGNAAASLTMATTNSDSQPTSPLSDVVIPSTPPPQPMYTSNSAEMTPPPSTQPPKTNFSTIRPKSAQRTLFPQSPPSIVKPGTEPALPSPEDIAKAETDELRNMAQGLAVAVAEARMSAAHFKLQHSLLTMESQEAAQRAEIEHQMTRREVEVLQAAEHHNRRVRSATPRSSHPPAQPQIDALLRTCKDLEEEKAEVEHRLQKAKKIIEQEMDKSELLYEENLMLKRRIRENREHFTMLRQSPGFSTPRNDFATPQRRPGHQFTEPARSHVNSRNQDPFAALLAADQMLSGEAASLPSTPTKTQPSKFRQGHTRGAFSLSSLQTTPAHSRPLTAVEAIHHTQGSPDHRLAYSAPSTQRVGLRGESDRRDRDSTISVSDEEALTDGDLPQSQASSLATNMLRRNPGSQESSSFPGKAEKSSKMLQTKIFGQVKKAATDRKRHASFGENDAAKKMKLTEGVGLGIGAWGTSKAR